MFNGPPARYALARSAAPPAPPSSSPASSSSSDSSSTCEPGAPPFFTRITNAPQQAEYTTPTIITAA